MKSIKVKNTNHRYPTNNGIAIIQLICLLLVFALCIVISQYLFTKEIKDAVGDISNTIQVVEVPTTTTIKEIEIIKEEITNEDYIENYMSLRDKESLEEWFQGYKVLISNLEEPQPTLQDVFTEEEISILYRLVESEIGEGSFEAKTNVAEIVFNRYESKEWGLTLKAVMISPNQFSITRSIYSIDENTKLACEYAFMFDIEELKDATSFHSGRRTETFNGRSLKYFDGYHYFY